MSNKNKSLWILCLALLNSLCPLGSSERLHAEGAGVTLGTENELEGDFVPLTVGGFVSAPSASFKIRVNYNKYAFALESVEPVQHEGINVEYDHDAEKGVVTLTGSNSGGLIPAGDASFATLNLRAKKPGYVEVALLDAYFYNSEGDIVSGTVLSYFSINTQDPMAKLTTTAPPPETEASSENEGSDETVPVPAESEKPVETVLETIIITLPRETSQETSIAAYTSEPTEEETASESSETTETAAPPLTSAAPTTVETIAPTEIQKDGNIERSGFLGDKTFFLIVIAAVLLLIIVILLIGRRRPYKKKNSRRRR